MKKLGGVAPSRGFGASAELESMGREAVVRMLSWGENLEGGSVTHT